MGTAVVTRCAVRCGPSWSAISREGLQAESMEKLCMQVAQRRRGRTEVAIGLCAGIPEAKARKSKD